ALLAALVPAAVPAPADAPAPTSAAVATSPRGPCLETSFELANNKVWVPVRVNGSDPQWFLLDSGAMGMSVVSRECADRLGLATDEPQAATGVGAGEGVQV